MLQFYKTNNYSLFHCKLTKEPKYGSYRSTENHITVEEAQEAMDQGGFIGAWLPKNHVVLDIDVKGKTHDVDGMKAFNKLCEDLSIQDNLLKTTLVIKTGSGGFHLYFKLPSDIAYTDLSQKSLTSGLDVRTHLGYVIAAGTSGYSVVNEEKIQELPEELLSLIKRKTTEKAKDYHPAKELSVKMLQKVLDRVPSTNFNSNDAWQEFITSAIATAGNSPEVITILEDWSKADPQYSEDTSIRKRLETFEPSGGITVGTFLHMIKAEGISKYIYNQVRVMVGTEYNFTQDFSENFKLPFKVDFSLIRENMELMKSFYYTKHQTSAVDLFAKLVDGSLYYIESEKRFYYYNGNLWKESTGIIRVIFTVLLQAGFMYFTDFSDGKDDDADECLSDYMKLIGAISLQQKFEGALKQHPDIYRDKMLWDSPELEATLTLEDCVMDFSEKDKVFFRKGLKKEHRRLCIDLKQKDFKDDGQPTYFKEFLKDIFRDPETRKTATYALSTMLSGTGKFRKIQIWNGSGNNGKSALMNVMRDLIGDRSCTYTPSVLLSSDRRDSLTPELAALRGSLVAFSSETDEAKKVSEGAIKNLTGDEMISANPKYQGVIHFQTTFQLVLATNFLPTFSAHDNAFVNRLLILPFQTCFYESDEMKEAAERRGAKYFKPKGNGPEIREKIMAERAQILMYLAKRYQELGVTIPESKECLKAKSHYVKDNNGIVEMITEMIEYDETKNYFTPTKDIVDFYNSEQHTRYSSRFIVSRIKEVYPMVDNHSQRINGKLTRGLRNIRLIYGAYPEGYSGNYSEEEVEKYTTEEIEAKEITRFNKEATF